MKYEELMKMHAPMIHTLVALDLKYELSGIGKMVLEHETLSDRRGGKGDEPVYEIVGIPLPVISVVVGPMDNEDKAIDIIYKKAEDEAYKSLLKAAGKPVSGIAEAHKQLMNNKYYGPYLVWDKVILQLVPYVVRVVLSEIEIVQVSSEKRVQGIITLDCRKDAYGNYGITSWE